MKTKPFIKHFPPGLELTDAERALTEPGYMDDCRRDARRQMGVVALVLVCIAALACGLAYHLLTR